jgi:hypothetical protein
MSGEQFVDPRGSFDRIEVGEREAVRERQGARGIGRHNGNAAARGSRAHEAPADRTGKTDDFTVWASLSSGAMHLSM